MDYVTKNNDGTIHWNLGTGTAVAGTQWQAPQSQSGLHGVGSAGIWFIDINGDGLVDYVTKNNDGTIHWNLDTAQTFKMTAIYGAPGLSIGVEMHPYVAAALNPLTYPRLTLPRGIQVVSKVNTSNAAGSANVVSYSYGGLIAELGTGRGMQGFQWMKSKEEATNIETYTEYRQDWPYTGLPIKKETYYNPWCLASGQAGPCPSTSGNLLSRTGIIYACKTGTGADCQPVPANCNLASNVETCKAIANARVFPYASSVTEQSWDLNGTAMPTTITNTRSDKSASDDLYWGDASMVEVITDSSSASSKKLVQNEYYPSVTANGKWIAGRLRKSTAVSTLSDSPAFQLIGVLPGNTSGASSASSANASKANASSITTIINYILN